MTAQLSDLLFVCVTRNRLYILVFTYSIHGYGLVISHVRVC